MKSVVNLHNSCNESVDASDEFLLSTGYEPNAYDFNETSVEPYMQLMDSPPLFSDKVSSADPDYDDAALEDMLHQAHRAQAYHSLREDLSVSLSSSMSDRTGRPVGDRERGDAYRQVDEQPTKRSNKNDDISAVAFLKKGDWHERGPVTDQGHDRSGQPGKKRGNEMERGPSKHRSSNGRQLGCVFQDLKPPKSILRKSKNMQRAIQRVKLTKAIARHTKIRDPNPSLGYICPGGPHQRSPNAPKFEDRSQERGSWPKVY